MERKRRRGAELQAAFEQAARDYARVPAHLCMGCKRPRAGLFTFDALLGDLQSERETGELVMQGKLRMRLCPQCYRVLLAMHEATGTPVRPLD